MTNRIRVEEILDHRLNPAEAELHVRVVPEHVSRSSELRGRLTGPVCAYASTMEVAYPLRPLAKPTTESLELSSRVVVPEPSHWEPVSPFLYHGSVELWEEDRLCDQIHIQHGFRILSRSMRSFLLNGREWKLRAVRYRGRSRTDLANMREAGINTLVVPVSGGLDDLWNMADQLGFFVIVTVAANEYASTQMIANSDHPSCFGWLIDREALERELAEFPPGKRGRLCGVRARSGMETLPDAIHYAVFDEAESSAMGRIRAPVVIQLKRRWDKAASARVLSPEFEPAGWIYES